MGKKGAKNGPKMGQKWAKNGPNNHKNDPKITQK